MAPVTQSARSKHNKAHKKGGPLVVKRKTVEHAIHLVSTLVPCLQTVSTMSEY